MITNINKLFFSPILASISNVSTMIEDVTLLQDLRQELKVVSSNEHEAKLVKDYLLKLKK